VGNKNNLTFALSIHNLNYQNMKKIAIVPQSRQVKVLTNVTNFSKLNVINPNRPTKEAHVKRLVDSFKRFGTAGVVIVVIQTRAVNGKLEYYIADGQHRRIAAERTKLPLSINIVELVEDTLFNLTQYIAMLNDSSKSWTSHNYINAFSKNNISEYKLFNDTMNETGLKATDLLQIFLNTTTTKEFKSGSMKFPDIDDSLELLKATKMVKEIIPNKAFVRRSLYKVFRMAKDYKRMAKAIINASKHPAFKYSENEQELYNQLILIYRSEFNVR
jgi:hypothetical protein